MKKLKLEHQVAEYVRNGQKHSTWRLFDDKDLSVNDVVLLIDKVDPTMPDTWRAFGTAKITSVVERRLGDITDADLDGYESFRSTKEMLARYREYYGSNVSTDTPVKIITFTYSPDIPIATPTDVVKQNEKVTIFADGGSRGNPGPSAAGFVIYDDHHQAIINRGVYLGVTTNNQAEYTALKMSLEEAKSIGAHEVHVYMDSMLVINQMRGIFKVKNRDLWPIHDAIKQLTDSFDSVDFTQVPRESNRLADAAVNAALDAHLQQNDKTVLSKSGIIVS